MMEWNSNSPKVRIVRSGKASNTGPNMNKIMKKRDFISRNILEANRLTLVDIANARKQFQNLLALLKL